MPTPPLVSGPYFATSRSRSSGPIRVREALATAGALVGGSDHGTTKSLYAKDPDGLEFEVVWLIPADLLDERAIEARTRIGRLDLDGEIARYGADTRGGVGISVAG